MLVRMAHYDWMSMCRLSARATLPHFGMMCSLMMPSYRTWLKRAIAAAGRPVDDPRSGRQPAVRGLHVRTLQLGHLDRRREVGRFVLGLEAGLVGLSAFRRSVPLAAVGHEVRLNTAMVSAASHECCGQLWPVGNQRARSASPLRLPTSTVPRSASPNRDSVIPTWLPSS